MKQILCYGDSNTWGADPADDSRRFEWPVRWPGVLQRELGNEFHVVGGGPRRADDGLRRSTASAPERQGPLAPALEMPCPARPGHPDAGDQRHQLRAHHGGGRPRTAPPSWLISSSAASWVRAAPRPKLLLVCPPPVGPFENNWRPELWAGADEKSRALPQEFARVAAALGVPWLDAGRVVTTSPLDGWHLEASQHELLGVAVAARVRELLG